MDHILLLHGALGSAAQLAPLEKMLAARYVVHALDFPGHGGSRPGDFSMEGFSGFVHRYIHEKALSQPGVFGYSMGGYAALNLERKHPGSLRFICTLGTKLHWDPAIAAREEKQLQPEIIEAKVPLFAKNLQELHAPANWKDVVRNTAVMLQALGAAPLLDAAAFASINIPVRLLRGDRDKMVSLEETVEAYRQLPQGQLGILPRTGHALADADTALLASLIGS